MDKPDSTSAPDRRPLRVAVLGAGGIMGKPIARNIARAGIEVRAWNRSAGKLADLIDEEGVTVSASPAEAASGADLLLTIMSDAAATLATMESVVDGGEALDGALWVQMATIGIEGTARCGELAQRSGLTLVDAPVLGTKGPAEAGELLVLASGPEELRDLVAPVFEAIGGRTTWVGEVGASSRLKLVINTWIVSQVEAVAETVALAEGIGVEPQQLLDALAGTPLDSLYLRGKSEAMLAGDFAPTLSLAMAAKDAGLAVAAARSAELELPMLDAICARLEAAAQEHGDKDVGATYLLSSKPA